jgi:nicotinate-nucleotide adenylyltransferase
MEVPALAISSSDIRARVASRRPVRYLLPEDVASYVEKNGLYREPVV